MSGKQFLPIAKPYMKFWQECLADPRPRPAKPPVKVKPRKKGKKARK